MSKFFGRSFASIKIKEIPSFLKSEVFSNVTHFYQNRFITSFRALSWEKELINIHKQRLSLEEAQKVAFKPKTFGLFIGYILIGTFPSIYFHEKSKNFIFKKIIFIIF